MALLFDSLGYLNIFVCLTTAIFITRGKLSDLF